jgi:hypothetical protein
MPGVPASGCGGKAAALCFLRAAMLAAACRRFCSAASCSALQGVACGSEQSAREVAGQNTICTRTCSSVRACALFLACSCSTAFVSKDSNHQQTPRSRPNLAPKTSHLTQVASLACCCLAASAFCSPLSHQSHMHHTRKPSPGPCPLLGPLRACPVQPSHLQAPCRT